MLENRSKSDDGRTETPTTAQTASRIWLPHFPSFGDQTAYIDGLPHI